MNADVRDVVRLAEQLGFCFQGYSGTGHVQLAHANGTVTIPSTPSDHRWRANTLAHLEHVAGRKLPRVKHRKSHKAPQRSGFSLDRAVEEQRHWHDTTSATVEELHAQREQLIAKCRELARNRGTIHDIPPVLDRIAHLEAGLRGLHQPVEPFDPFTLRD